MENLPAQVLLHIARWVVATEQSQSKSLLSLRELRCVSREWRDIIDQNPAHITRAALFGPTHPDLVDNQRGETVTLLETIHGKDTHFAVVPFIDGGRLLREYGPVVLPWSTSRIHFINYNASALYQKTGSGGYDLEAPRQAHANTQFQLHQQSDALRDLPLALAAANDTVVFFKGDNLATRLLWSKGVARRNAVLCRVSIVTEARGLLPPVGYQDVSDTTEHQGPPLRLADLPNLNFFNLGDKFMGALGMWRPTLMELPDGTLSPIRDAVLSRRPAIVLQGVSYYYCLLIAGLGAYHDSLNDTEENKTKETYVYRSGSSNVARLSYLLEVGPYPYPEASLIEGVERRPVYAMVGGHAYPMVNMAELRRQLAMLRARVLRCFRQLQAAGGPCTEDLGGLTAPLMLPWGDTSHDGTGLVPVRPENVLVLNLFDYESNARMKKKGSVRVF